jgi:hypothetical protein
LHDFSNIYFNDAGKVLGYTRSNKKKIGHDKIKCHIDVIYDEIGSRKW